MMNRLLVSINPNLKNEWGHFLHYDEILKEELEEKNDNIIILASKDLDIKLKEKKYIIARMTEHSTHFFRLGSKKQFVKGLLKLWRDLIVFAKDINISIGKDQKVTYFMYLASIHHLWAIILHAVYNKFRYRYVLNLFWFHLSVGMYNKKPLNTWKSLFLRILKNVSKLFRIRLCTDSRELNRKLKVNFKILPMFSTTGFNDAEIEESPKNLHNPAKRKRMIVSFPGLMRKGKGYDKSCQLINHIINAEDNRFFFFLRKLIDKGDRGMVDYLSPLDTRKEFVKIFCGILSNEEYKSMFIKSDIVFISYRKEEFYTRTSAVLADAILLKKPVIGPMDTWIGNIIEKYSFGETYEDGNIEEMYTVLQKVYAGYSFYKNNLIEHAPHWLGRNNAAEALKFIMGDQK